MRGVLLLAMFHVAFTRLLPVSGTARKSWGFGTPVISYRRTGVQHNTRHPVADLLRTKHPVVTESDEAYSVRVRIMNVAVSDGAKNKALSSGE